MKKIIAFILALTMIFVLCACGDNTDTKSPDEQSTELTEKQDESNTSVDESDGQGLSDEEMLTGVWLNVDHVNYDKRVDLLYLTTDGYLFFDWFDLSTKEFFSFCNYVALIGDSISSDCLVDYFTADGTAGTIEEVFMSNYYNLYKYEINNNEIIVTSPDSTKEIIAFEYNPMVTMNEFVITEPSEEGHYIRYDNHMEDSYRYFVGNWNVSYYRYYAERDSSFSSDYMLSLGENLSFNTSSERDLLDSNNWSYMNGELRIGDDWPEEDSVVGTTIRLSYNQFAVFCLKDTNHGEQYYSWIFERA